MNDFKLGLDIDTVLWMHKKRISYTNEQWLVYCIDESQRRMIGKM